MTIDDFNLTDDVARWSARRPSHPALVAGDRIVDYGALEALVARGAGWLAHAMEQQREGRMVRPSSRYVGPIPAGAEAPG